MATLMKLLSRSIIRKSNNGLISLTFTRNHWNKDFMPGKIPQTKEEIEKAAKKYNMTVADYETYPDDGLGKGDYPKLPYIGYGLRDPYYPWDFPEMKRNFNEPLHIDADMMGEERYDAGERLRIPMHIQFLTLFGVLTAFAVLYFFFEDYKIHRPVLPKQYPKEGEIHYTFEPAE